MYYSAGQCEGKRLICFPYEGGSSHIFRNWPEALKDSVEVIPLELPGRGRRISERLYYKLSELIHELIPSILPYLDKQFYFFGHGMGALIAFEMAVALRKNFLPEPEHLFVSAFSAPQRILKEKFLIFKLMDDEFIENLKGMNALPGALLKNRDLVELMLPIVRADFSVCGTYNYKAGLKADCPITAFLGLADVEISIEEFQEWAEVTNSSFELNLLPGNHFYITKYEKILLKILSEKLSFYSQGVKPV